jgi:hypothetical protein
MEYLVSEWVLDSDGTPHVTVSSFKTYEGSLNLYNDKKNKIKECSKDRQFVFKQINSDEDYDNYTDNMDDYTTYVIEENINDVISYYQDFGWKRPMGVSLQKVTRSESSDLNWKTGLSTYPISHGGQW